VTQNNIGPRAHNPREERESETAHLEEAIAERAELKTFDRLARVNRFKGVAVAEVRFKKNPLSQ
jgi:hypothetical protein